MAYDSLTTRSDASALIPEESAASIVQSVIEQSIALRTFPRVSMSRGQQRLPVLGTLPIAYFRGSDTGLAQTTETAWRNVYLNAEEIVVLMPVPRSVVADAEFDIFGEARPRLAEALARKLDAAILFGTEKPSTWGGAVVPTAEAAGHSVARGTHTADEGGLAEDLNDAFALVEDDGFDVNTVIAGRNLRGALRGVRNADGDRLPEVSPEQVYGVGVSYGASGLWTPADTLAVVGDASQGRLGVRNDIEFRILDQAVITDNAGVVIQNLAQQGLVAIEVTARFAWAVPNPTTLSNGDDNSRYPFAVLTA
jgi:HK97 family phage major capsid protein